MSYRTVIYEPEHREGVLDLQRNLWSPDLAKNDRYLAWKYERNPFSPDAPLVSLVLEGHSVVAMHGAFDFPFVGPEGRPVGGLWTGDLVVDPEHRRRGLAQEAHRALRQAARDRGLRCLLNASSGRLSRDLYLSGGWKSVGEFSPLQCAARSGSTDRARLSDVDRRVREGANPPGSQVTVSDQARPEAMAVLSASARDTRRIGIRKDPAYFRWRFANPLCDYRFFYHGPSDGQNGPTDGRPLTGYAVLHAHGPEHDTGLHIVDWDAATPSAREALLDAILRARGDAQITTWSEHPDSPFLEILEDRGFHALPVAAESKRVLPALLVRPLVDAEAGPPEGLATDGLAGWDLRMVASDYY